MDVDEMIQNVLTHHGIKGMKWGIRRNRTPTSVAVSQKGKKLKAKGGENQPAHKDAIKAKTIGQTKKKSGLHALSDQELRDYANRLQLEASVNRLETEKKNAGGRWISKFLSNSGNQTANTASNEVSQSVGRAVGKAAVKKGTKVAVKTGVAAAIG